MYMIYRCIHFTTPHSPWWDKIWTMSYHLIIKGDAVAIGGWGRWLDLVVMEGNCTHSDLLDPWSVVLFKNSGKIDFDFSNFDFENAFDNTFLAKSRKKVKSYFLFVFPSCTNFNRKKPNFLLSKFESLKKASSRQNFEKKVNSIFLFDFFFLTKQYPKKQFSYEIWVSKTDPFSAKFWKKLSVFFCSFSFQLSIPTIRKKVVKYDI